MNVLTRYLLKLPKQPRRLLRIALYGMVAGGLAVLFHYTIQFIYEYGLVRLSRQSLPVFLGGSFAILMSSSLVVGYLLNNFCREASGSGIPQLKLSFWKDFGHVPWRVVWVKFVAGALSVGGGSSLGREGPSVQMAGGAASNLAVWLGEPKQNRREAAASGAAAGLAAAFNTPIAAVTFVMEEIIQDLNSRFLGGVLLASIVGAFIVFAVMGEHPAFQLASEFGVSWSVYLLTPLVALVASLMGAFFQKATLDLRRRRKEFERVPVWMRPTLGAGVTWIIGVAVFIQTDRLGVFSLGYDDLSAGLRGQLDWQTAGVLLVAKLVATIACYGFMGCGGIFSPTLFFGGMCGALIAGVADWGLPQLGLSTGDHAMLAVVGMSACLGAVVRAPMTSILIVFEMTHQFSMVPALMLGTLVSQAVGIALSKHNFYDALLLQDGHNIEHVIPPRDLQSWQQLPVSAIANFQPVVCTSLAPPDVAQLLKSYPYDRFPVVEDKVVRGILNRVDAAAALAENRPPKLETVIWALPHNSIRELTVLLIESASGVVLLREKADGSMIGLVTLHDLLRAEVSMGREGQ